MTPKEKAKEIVYKYENLVTSWDCYSDTPIETSCRLPDMKACALICVNEMLIAVTTIADRKFDYYAEVKLEIEKL